MSRVCPCGSGESLAICCGPCLNGRPAVSAVALMRSRYTAFVLGDVAYLRASWATETCPADLQLADAPRWLRLALLGSRGGGPGDLCGEVEFRAWYLQDGQLGQLHETSRFERRGGDWCYVDGDIAADSGPLSRPGRNQPCPCGSGRKFKRCCASD